MSAIQVEIDLHAPAGQRYVGDGGEEGPQYEEITLLEAIISAAANTLVATAEKQMRSRISETVEERVRELVDERLPAIIDAAIAEPLEVTDDWGSRRKPKTVRELLIERAREQMIPRQSNYQNATVMHEVLRKEIDSVLHKELTEEIAAARAAVKAQVTAKAAELLAAETLRAAGVR